MTTMIRIRMPVVMLAGFLASMMLGPGSALSLTDRIIAVVNKEVITWSDLEHEIEDEYKRLKAKYAGEELDRQYSQKQREVLNNLIEDRLLLQEAKAKGLSVSDDEINAAIRRTPLTPTQTEEDLRQQLLVKRLFEYEVRRNVVVEEEEIRRYYDTNPSLFVQAPQYRLRQILLEGQEEFERERARKQAQALHDAWTPQMSLDDLAEQNFKPIHELGWVREKELIAPLGKVVTELKPGHLSDPVETPLGFHLLMVEDIRQPEPVPFELVEGEIKNLLFRERSAEAYRHWLTDLKRKAFIEVKF